MNKADLLRLPLGTKVVFNQKFFKTYEPRPLHKEPVQTYKPFAMKTAVGVYIGYRFLQEGYTAYSEDSRDWVQLNTIPCALVITSPRKNPIRVPIDCVERLHE